MHVVLWILVLLCAAGCTVPSESGGDADAGEKPCDGKNSCDECSKCAAQLVCANELTACENNGACQAIDSCVGGCGADLMCKQKCVDDNPAGATDYDTASRCIYCNQCAKDCAGYRVCG